MMPKLLALATLILLAGCDQGSPTLKARLAAEEADSLGRIGRFRIVNGMPSTARNIMLLDTKTGKTWIMCETKDSTTTTTLNWCAMSYYGHTGAP